VCRQVRIEREHCCDDRAVVACGDAAMYVEALAALPPWNPAGMALAANGGSLKSRAARLLGRKHKARRPSLPTVTGLVLLGLLAGAVAMAQTAIPARPAKASSAYLSNDKNPVMLQPIQETHTLPPYPKQSVHLKEQGRVILAVTVGTNGAVSRAAVVKPSGYQRLDNAALQFVKSHWRWQPAMRIGKPVAAKTRVSVLFKLRHPQPQQSY
jgi:TonB family protein